MNYEGRRDYQGISVNAGTVPTASYRAGNLQYEYAEQQRRRFRLHLTPADIQGMDPQGIGNDAAMLQVLNSYPQGNDPTQGDGLNTDRLPLSRTPSLAVQHLHCAHRLERGSNGKHTLFWRGNLQNDDEPTRARLSRASRPQPRRSPTTRALRPATRR